jgi:Domain of unknown function (DUF6249)
MKTTFLTCLCSIALGLSLFGQSPTAPATSASVQASATASVAPSSTPDSEDDGIERDVKRRVKHVFGKTSVSVNSHGPTVSHSHDNSDDDDFGGIIAIPIVAIIFSTLFGAPVMVVAAIMFFSYLKSRSLHRTVRSMVEKGQEVPAALFAPPPIVRQRSDLRRGVVLVMVGFGLMIFFGAMSDWDGGVWSLGVIPFVIGLGYLLVWKLEGRRDKVPPLP